MSESRDTLILLASDALAFTRDLTEPGKQVIVDALRHAATKPVTEADEERFFQAMLDANLQVTADFNPDLIATLDQGDQ